MRLPPFSFVVLDTETTGFIPKVHHVIEYAAIRAEKGVIVDTYEHLFAVDQEIPPHIQVLTRIKQEDIASKPTFEEKRAEIEEKLAGVDLLIGQNLSFDIGMLRGEGIDLSNNPWIDTSMLASLVFPEFRSFSLQYMSAQLKLTHEPAHRALGDVRATLELFSRIWERLLELPPEKMAFAKEVMGKSSAGYKLLFDALESEGKKDPAWLAHKETEARAHKKTKVIIVAPNVGTVELQEEGLHAACLQDIIDATVADDSRTHWIAVKNLESALKRIDVPDDVTVVHPPQLLLNPEAVASLKKQDTLTPEEALILLKITWWNPRTRNDIAVHGGEKDLWQGKLACAATSHSYTEQFSSKNKVFVLDHKQLLAFLADPSHAAHKALTSNAHVIVDDASMMEDTATKAYGYFASVDGLRAAANGDAELTRFTDLLSIFAEKVRGGEDQYFMTPGDLRRPEAIALRERAGTLLKRSDLPEKTIEQLKAIHSLLEENLPEKHIIWIERRLDGSITIISGPKHADDLLKKYLYDQYATTLLVPKGADTLPEIVPAQMPVHHTTAESFAPCPLTVSFPTEQSLTSFLQNPPPGKTILLAGSKRLIEQAFVVHTENLEKEGVTLICQGLNGGQNRMESDFLAATSPAILMITPFMYEGLDLAPECADRLVLDTVPFDHPNHPIMSQRKNRYKNSFNEYAMPRLEYRLFRLMRTFCRHKRDGAEMMVFDKRLVQKDYGARLQRYMAQFATHAQPIIEAPADMQPSAIKKATKKPATKKEPKLKEKSDGQMQIPL